MKMIGIKISSVQIGMIMTTVTPIYEGYWRCKELMESTGIERNNRYDAEQDAVKLAKAYSIKNNIILIIEGGRI